MPEEDADTLKHVGVLILYKILLIYTGGCQKMYTHFNVAQAVVRRNQKCPDANGNHFGPFYNCRSQT